MRAADVLSKNSDMDRPVLSELTVPLSFVHIPKAGGGTLTALLTHAYGSGMIRDAGNYARNPEEVAEKARRAQKKGFPRALVGHVPYSVFRSYMPQDTLYITMLRETVGRVLSHYYRHLHKRSHSPGFPQPESLAHALEMGLPQVTNLSTRLLCDDPFDKLSDNALDQAKRNIRHFAFVGLRERFDESIVLLQRRLGLTEPVGYGQSRHVTTGERPTASEDERQLLLEKNALDVELYAYARELYDEAVSSAEGLAAEVERQRALNARKLAEDDAALDRVTEWLDRELPPGARRPSEELWAAADAAAIPRDHLREALWRKVIKKKNGMVIRRRAEAQG